MYSLIWLNNIREEDFKMSLDQIGLILHICQNPAKCKFYDKIRN